jgi:hypothetical protein
MSRSVVISARAFILLWLVCTAIVLGYAFVDLRLSPALQAEHSFSMQPDLSQIWEMRHWGGRLVRERAWGLLVSNALVLGGLVALGLHGLTRFVSRRVSSSPAPRASVFPAERVPTLPPRA